jgi:hypothetical protein
MSLYSSGISLVATVRLMRRNRTGNIRFIITFQTRMMAPMLPRQIKSSQAQRAAISPPATPPAYRIVRLWDIVEEIERVS